MILSYPLPRKHDETLLYSNINIHKKISLKVVPKIPGVTDVLIANSTVPGFVSNRNTRDGTWFVQCFEKVVREGIKHKMDIRDMFDRMQEKMQEMESKNPNENINEKRKQTFELVNRGFTKKLYLNKSLKS